MRIMKVTEADLEQNTVLYTKEDHVAVVTLNRPEVRNALNWQVFQEIDKIFDLVQQDDDIRVMVFTGADPAWCSGDDVKQNFLGIGTDKSFDEMMKGDRERELASIRGVSRGEDGLDHSLFSMFHSMPLWKKPVIAAVNGAVRGFGFSICLCCDIRIVSDRATFGAFMPRRGIPQHGMYPMLAPLIMGLSNALELALTSDVIDAQEAYRIGIANKLVKHEDLMPAALDMAKRIADLPTYAIELTKIGIMRNLNIRWQDELQWQAWAAQYTHTRPEQKEGSWNFVNKTGRDAIGADVGHVGGGKSYTGEEEEKGKK